MRMKMVLEGAIFVVPDVDTAAAAAAARSRRSSSVLLDRKAYFANHDNATTAEGRTSTGHTIKITFFLADPPAISYFCIHSPDLDDTDYAVAPLVVCSEMDLFLLRFSFNLGRVVEPGLREYFIYRADGVNPSFKPIPFPGPEILRFPRMLNPSSLGILPCGDGEFLLVSLICGMSLLDYDVYIFSSKTQQWTTRRVPVQAQPNLREVDVPRQFNKVITLGQGALGWVDLWRGILVFNVLREDSVIRIIPLPKPNFDVSEFDCPNSSRDVTCDNGLIKFVEMEHYYREAIVHRKEQVTIPNDDLCSAGIMYDSHLLLPNNVHVEEATPSLIPDGWKLLSYYRHTSWDYWRVGCIADCDDISIHNPRHYMLLPELRDYNTGKLTLRNLLSAFPYLSISGDDVVYLMSKVEDADPKAWVIGIHLEKKKLEVLEPYSAARAVLFNPDFCPCAFSNNLGTSGCY